MLRRTSTTIRKKGRIAAAALGLLVWASAQITPAAGADFGYASPAAVPIYGDLHEARLAALARNAVGPTSALSAPLDASLAELSVRLHYAFRSERGLSSDRILQAEREVLLRNSDAFVRAKVRVDVGKRWRGFVYGDIGAADSALKWQGLAGIRDGHGLELLGGWRHVTYRFSPGMGLDSLDFAGPFLGAALAW
jgi:hypothetical protein